LGGGHTHCWDDVSYGAALKIAQLTHDEGYAAMVEKNLDFWLPGGGITYTPGGLAWLSPWVLCVMHPQLRFWPLCGLTTQRLEHRQRKKLTVLLRKNK